MTRRNYDFNIMGWLRINYSIVFLVGRTLHGEELYKGFKSGIIVKIIIGIENPSKIKRKFALCA